MKACLFVLAALVAAAWAEAPYPPSGWRPAKAFLLPVRARQEYGAPPRPVYGPPSTAASEPEATTPVEEEATTTEAVTEEATEEPTTEASENAVESGRGDTAEAQPALYYVLLPDGRLQRVLYTAGTPELGYNAQLRIHDVEPVPPAPVYAYAGPLTRILRK